MVLTALLEKDRKAFCSGGEVDVKFEVKLTGEPMRGKLAKKLSVMFLLELLVLLFEVAGAREARLVLSKAAT